MKRFGLLLKKWLQGCVALMTLYVVVSPGGITMRLSALAVAVACSGLWVKSKRELDALVSVPLLSMDVAVHLDRRPEPVAASVKMPKRYPRPVYIHRVTFR